MHRFASGALRGELTVPGDKSISHRALILGSACREPVRVTNLNLGRDVRATSDALIALGVRIDAEGEDVIVHGAPLRESASALDCMNSGSTTRMMLGVCAGARVRAHFVGDESLSKRPMEPVAAQLRAFGATVETTEGHLPMEMRGRNGTETTRFILVSPSAQVKSALLLAGTFSETPISIAGDRASRDHTERMLSYLGADIAWDGKNIDLRHANLTAQDIDVAGDPSAAAFFITAATLAPESDVTIRNVCVNATRMGLVDALLAMGAQIELESPRLHCGEPIADIHVRHAELHATTVGAEIVPRAIDEIPLIAIAAAFATGETKITGIGELRTKESDRIAAIERLLAAVGIACEILPNGILVRGGSPRAHAEAVVETHHDHRTAMAAAVLACAAGPIAIDRADSIDVSFPSFIETLGSVLQS